ncbi:TorD/DmsD family molecular chaperone [Arcanobacterium buesumense]|uniref:Molecular chaperone TorD family protein n=1 Tax=Arcanobacterium buesumense TaxID=2722751 RepID=A0A6H2EM84_9ACTO|nr:molecular chaperone TorD family protein [Arcanobacterium buesumense]QJC22186.1 molecular chaperone TorD family protein [Arcanobacterium buesumense]
MLSPAEYDAFAAAFTVLGRLHIQPADGQTRSDVIGLLHQWPLDSALSQYSSRGLELLAESAQRAENDDAIITDQDTLYGISASAKVPPYESVHCGQDRLVFDRQTLEVRQEYAKLALQAPKYNTEPDDHIGLELDFLGRCCIAALDGHDMAQELAVSFTKEHIVTWMPAMLAHASQEATTAWLRGVIALTQGALETWFTAIGLTYPHE